MQLDIDGAEQDQNLWCWAACTQMVLRALGIERAQCEIVSDALGVADCCSGDPPEQSLRLIQVNPEFVDFLNAKVAPSQYVAGALDPTTLRSRLNSGPVAACLENATRGHVVLVVGWHESNDADNPIILINDPQTGATARSMRYGELVLGLGLADAFGGWRQSICIELP